MKTAATKHPRSSARTIIAFGGVGIASTLLYFTCANTLVMVGAAPVLASLIAYAIGGVFSYYGHRHLSFASTRSHAEALPRFITTFLIGLTVALALPLLGQIFGWPPLIVFLTVCVIVPIINFIVLDVWVFGGSVMSRMKHLVGPHLAFWLPCGIAILVIYPAAYFFNEWRWGTIPDTSWLITVVEQVSSGKRLYVDIIETNPPFSIWLYTPPVQLAALLGVAPEIIVRLYVLTICLVCALITAWFLSASRIFAPRTAAFVGIAIFALATLVAGNAFTERDQIGALAVLPMLVLAAWRCNAEQSTPSARHWIIAGLGASILVMVKPYYVLAVIATAGYIAFKRRNLFMLFMPEFVLAAAATILYIVLCYTIHPVYFSEILPLLREGYLAFRVPWNILLLLSTPFIIPVIIYMVIRKTAGAFAFSDILIIASLAASTSFFLQGKGWLYHLYPAIFLAALALLTYAAHALPAFRPEMRRIMIACTSLTVLASHALFWEAQKPDAGLVQLGLQGGGHPTVGLIGSDISTGHPLARMINGRWIDLYCSDWLMRYALVARNNASQRGDVESVRHFDDVVANYFARKKQNLVQNPAELLIVARQDYTVNIAVDKYGFGEILAGYEKLGEAGSASIYRRLKTGGSN